MYDINLEMQKLTYQNNQYKKVLDFDIDKKFCKKIVEIETKVIFNTN